MCARVREKERDCVVFERVVEKEGAGVCRPVQQNRVRVNVSASVCSVCQMCACSA